MLKQNYSKTETVYFPLVIALALLILGCSFIYCGFKSPINLVIPQIAITLIYFGAGSLFIFISISAILSTSIIGLKFKGNAPGAKVAILFIERTRDLNLIQFYWSGAFWLIWGMLRTNQKYNVYFINSKSALERILLNKTLKIFYIFGHGRRYGVCLLKPKFYEYSSLNGRLNGNEKTFIAQLHCNDDKNHQLGDVSLESFTNEKYISKGDLYFPQIWYYLFKTWIKGSYISN